MTYRHVQLGRIRYLRMDSNVRLFAYSLFRNLSRQMGAAILYISHDLLSVATIADRVAVMHEGEIAECRAAQAIFTDPKHPYTRSLIAALPTPAALLTGKGVAPLQPSAKSHVVGHG